VRPFKRHQDDKAIVALAFPALGALTADPLYSLIDTALVGHLGKVELGAVAIGTAAFTASFWIFSFLAYGVTPRVAMTVGAGDDRGATEQGVQALLIAAVAGLAIAVAGLVLAGPVVRLLGAERELEGLATSYLGIRMLSAPAMLIALVGHGWLRGVHDTKTAMLIAVAGAAANAVLDYLLIYPAGLGVQGAAWATVISQAAVAGAFSLTLVARFTAPVWRPHARVMLSLMSIGADLIVRTGALLLAMTLATSLAARMGTTQLAAWQIAIQLFLLLSLVMDSLAIAAQALVAKHLGARDGGSARRVGDRLMELGALFGVALGVILYAVRGPLASAFGNDPEVLETAARLIAWLALIQPVAAVAFTLDGILIGALRTRFLATTMVLASGAYAAVGIVSFASGWGLAGLASGMALWLIVRTATTGAFYLSGAWARTA
jgi:MATE family multidrug resistance protein